jgi:hypothetical protein
MYTKNKEFRNNFFVTNMTVQQAGYCGVMYRVRTLLLYLQDYRTASILFYCDFNKQESKLSIQTFLKILYV